MKEARKRCVLSRASEPQKIKPGTDLLSRQSQYHRPGLLNDCVRNGNRCGQTGMGTGKKNMLDVEPRTPSRSDGSRIDDSSARSPCPLAVQEGTNKCSQANRHISTGELNALLHLHFQPINLVFYQEPDGEASS